MTSEVIENTSESSFGKAQDEVVEKDNRTPGLFATDPRIFL
jgi:hypothetical protein